MSFINSPVFWIKIALIQLFYLKYSFHRMAQDFEQLGNLVTVNLILTKGNLKLDFSRVKFLTSKCFKTQYLKFFNSLKADPCHPSPPKRFRLQNQSKFSVAKVTFYQEKKTLFQ